MEVNAMINEIGKMVDEIKELPFLIEEVENWRNEMNDILNDIFGQEEQKGLRESAQEQFMKALNEAEGLRNRLQANISILNLCTAFISTGKINELTQILNPSDRVQDLAGGREQRPEEKQETAPAEQGTKDSLELKTFKVLEAKKKPDGETRAWCQMPDGNRAAVLSEGEIGELFVKSKGKEIKVWCSREGKEYNAEKLA
jgi:vacuolar-type H+-ATPase subunit I/STV1